MCGINGVVTARNLDINQLLVKAQSTQLHRGPDSQNILLLKCNCWNIGLGHQRLSIVDLTEAGNQPMAFQGGKGFIVYNGEIYNYREIKRELESDGYRFTSNSDTEVILTALHHWGPEKAIPKFNGMWAFVWLDLEKKRLILSRDRVGIKPLYYFLGSQELYFASELKTILEMVPLKFNLNYQKIGEYLIQSLSQTSDDTFFKDIFKLSPATFCIIDLTSKTLKFESKNYWEIPKTTLLPNTEADLIEEIRELFIDSVRLRLRSDVPIGVLLSGGVDSSSIVAVMRKLLDDGSQLNILSAVSRDFRFDESPFIDKVGEFLNQDVKKVCLDFELDKIFYYLEKITWFNDEPVGSFSNVAHFLLMKEARDLGITVILSGQGADELLCGYKKYLGFYIQYLIRKKRYMKALNVLKDFWRNGTVLNQFSISESKRYLPNFLKPKRFDIRGEVLQDYQEISIGLLQGMDVIERQILDVKRFSIPVLTHYEDRMSMAWSREVRVPFLDYRLIEKLIPLSMDFKLKDGWTKYIFRKAMEPYLPKEIVWRKDKQGFINPQSEWLKNDLKKGVLEYFKEDSLIFKYKLINRQKLIQAYEVYCKQPAGKGFIWFKDIFNPLALEIWLRKFIKYLDP
ncbi:asparagine synthase (glutamine-hydrolyzing) [Bacillaceae bacterium]